MTIKNSVALSLQAPVDAANRLERSIWAEEQGYESVFITDGGGRMDGFTIAGAIAARTSRIRLCMSIVPVYTRPVAVFATSAMTMSHLATDRFVLGLGSSSHAMIEGWYGMPFTKPKTRVRETIELLRKMLAGEKSDYDGETVHSHNFRLGTPVKGHIPIHVAALRPGMLEMAGEMADGIMLNLAPLDVLPRMLEAIDKGAKRSGRRVEDLEISTLLSTFVTDDVAAAEQDFRNVAAFYYSTPVYNKFLRWVGYEKEAAQIEEGFRQKDRNMSLGAFDSELIHKFAVIGTAAQCRDKVRAYWKAGVQTPAVNGASTNHDVYRATIAEFTPAKMAR